MISGDIFDCHKWEEGVLLGSQGCMLLKSYNAQLSSHNKDNSVPHVSSVMVKKTVPWNLHCFMQRNESYFIFNNKFIICIKMLMTCDFCLRLYFINTTELGIFDGSGYSRPRGRPAL